MPAGMNSTFSKPDNDSRLPRSIRWCCIACGRQPMNDEVSTEHCAPGEAAGICPLCGGSIFAAESEVEEVQAWVADQPSAQKFERYALCPTCLADIPLKAWGFGWVIAGRACDCELSADDLLTIQQGRQP